jgi:hypothetical protein
VWTGLHLAQDRAQWRALMNTVKRKVGFHKRLGNSSITEQLVASEDGLSSMEQVSQ